LTRKRSNARQHRVERVAQVDCRPD
jgi:hypothetical protein